MGLLLYKNLLCRFLSRGPISKGQLRAEKVGFEPTGRCRLTGFQDQLLKPLGHFSGKNCSIAL